MPSSHSTVNGTTHARRHVTRIAAGLALLLAPGTALCQLQTNFPNDPALIDKLYRGEFLRIRRDNDGLRDLFAVQAAINAGGCTITDESFVAPTPMEINAWIRTLPSSVTLAIPTLVTHPNYFRAGLWIEESGGCQSERAQTLMKNLMRVVATEARSHSAARPGAPAQEPPVPTLPPSGSGRSSAPPDAALGTAAAGMQSCPGISATPRSTTIPEAPVAAVADFVPCWQGRCEAEAPPGNRFVGEYTNWCRCTAGVLATFAAILTETQRDALARDYRATMYEIEQKRPLVGQALGACRR